MLTTALQSKRSKSNVTSFRRQEERQQAARAYSFYTDTLWYGTGRGESFRHYNTRSRRRREEGTAGPAPIVGHGLRPNRPAPPALCGLGERDGAESFRNETRSSPSSGGRRIGAAREPGARVVTGK